jgi:hypothetical protein
MEQLKKRILILNKWLFSVIGAITSGLALVVPVAVATVVVVVVGAGLILADIRRESRREKAPLDWYSIPGSASEDGCV